MAATKTQHLVDTDDIREHDVLCGRGGRTNSHDGNKHFRSIVSENQSEYLASRKTDKMLIAKRIVSIIKGNGGRFLKPNGDGWIEVPDKRAQQKTSQALREGLDVRNKATRPKESTSTEPKPTIVTSHEKSMATPVLPGDVPSTMGIDYYYSYPGLVPGSFTSIPFLFREIMDTAEYEI
jgi:hypothetical protein